MSIPNIPDSGTFIINVNLVDRNLNSGESVIAPVPTPFTGTVVYDPTDPDAQVSLEDGFLQVAADHEIGTFELPFYLVDPNENQSNTATVSFIVVDFGPHSGDDIPNPEPVTVNQSSLIISHSHVVDILQRITSSINELEDEISVTMWIASNQSGTTNQYSYADLLDNIQGNEAFGDLRYTPTMIGSETAHLLFEYNGWEYELTVDFTVSAPSSGGAGIGLYDPTPVGDGSAPAGTDGTTVPAVTTMSIATVGTTVVVGGALALVIGMIAGPILGIAVLVVMLLIMILQ